MYFTQDDYLKIQKWLSRNSVRDTEFQEADTPLRGNETVVLVQNGHNRKILISDLVDQIFTLGTTDFLNVSEFSKEYNINLEKAITLVPPKSRKEGQVISFNNEEGNWEIYQFTGKVNQWTSIDLWKPFLADIPKEFITLNHLSQEVKMAINSGGGSGEILDGSIGTEQIADKAITTEKIDDYSIASNHIVSGQIEEKHLSQDLKDLLYTESEGITVLIPKTSGDKGIPIVRINEGINVDGYPIEFPSEFQVTGQGSTEAGSATIVYKNEYSGLEGEYWIIKNYKSDGHDGYIDTFAYVFHGGAYDSEAHYSAYVADGLLLKENVQDQTSLEVFANYKYDGTSLYRNIEDNKYYKMTNAREFINTYITEKTSLQEALNVIYSKIEMYG